MQSLIYVWTVLGGVVILGYSKRKWTIQNSKETLKLFVLLAYKKLDFPFLPA